MKATGPKALSAGPMKGSQAVLTANADESEPELAWADPRVDKICDEVFVTGDQLNLSTSYTGSSLSCSCCSIVMPASSLPARIFRFGLLYKAAECEVIRAEKASGTPR
jgi:hypothetical protein